VVELDGLGSFAVPGSSDAGRPIFLGIRPDDLRVSTGCPGALALEARINVIEPLGPDTLVYAEAGGRELVAKADGRATLHRGETVTLVASADALHVFDAGTEARLP
jgi:multiple sugar transport system ATP-binding protein